MGVNVWGFNSGFVMLKIKGERVSLECNVVAWRRDAKHDCVLCMFSFSRTFFCHFYIGLCLIVFRVFFLKLWNRHGGVGD